MNVINEIQRINDLELEKGITHTSASWHTKYQDSAWVFTGNLPHTLTEGDILCILSQYGEIEDIHLVRDGDTGKSRGFAFVKYNDARSCVLAVDNLTGSVILGRTVRVDHVENYRLPKHLQEKDKETNMVDETGAGGASFASSSRVEAGHAYKDQELANSFNIHVGQDLFAVPRREERKVQRDLSSTIGGESDMREYTEDRKRRKELRSKKRKEKEEHSRRKEERKRRKYGESKSSYRDRYHD